MANFEPRPQMTAQTVLYEAGLELAGVRLQAFTEHLLEAARTSPQASRDQLVRIAARHVDGGALAIVADEPELRERRLSRAVMTVQEAAETALHAIASELLDVANIKR